MEITLGPLPKTLLAAAALTLAALPARAVTILDLQNPGQTIFQQTLNNPCVIGDPSCSNPATFPQTTIPPNTANYDLFSPTYTVGLINSTIGSSSFFVAIDVNSTTQPLATEQLAAFNIFVNGTLQFTYNPATPTTLADVQQGNGFSDELLFRLGGGGIDLSGFGAGATVQFEAVVQNATDGREEFFLVQTNAPPFIPEPASLAIFGTALAGLGLLGRRRRKNI